jgi:hypothetical protein
MANYHRSSRPKRVRQSSFEQQFTGGELHVLFVGRDHEASPCC